MKFPQNTPFVLSGTPWYKAFDEGKLQYGRPLMLVINDSKQISVKHVSMLNSATFFIKPSNVEGAEFAYLNLTAQWYDDGTKEPHNTDGTEKVFMKFYAIISSLTWAGPINCALLTLLSVFKGIDPSDGSNNIHIHDVYIDNGDDSIAVKAGLLGACTKNILVENCHFLQGHGCSIGSVGEGCVENVMFRNITMGSQDNGIRLKTYSDQPGYVRNITWRDIHMKDTKNCITINANYKPPPPNPTAWINVSDLNIFNVVGLNCENDPEFICPSELPCTDIALENIQLYGSNNEQSTLHMDCEHAHGVASGTIIPKSCLKDP